jgi:hypothetical protein
VPTDNTYPPMGRADNLYRADELIHPAEMSSIEEDMKDRQHSRKRATLVTYLAIAVITISAVGSMLIIGFTEYFTPGAVDSSHWGVEMLRLTLVAALSFVMGTGTNN